MGHFVRGNKLPPLIPEFHNSVEILLPANSQVGDKIYLPGYIQAKVLRRCEKGDDGPENQIGRTEVPFIAGVYRTPEQFMKVAQESFHPIDSPSMVPDILKKNIFWILTTSPADIFKFRCEQMEVLHKRVVGKPLKRKPNKTLANRSRQVAPCQVKFL